MATKKSSHRPAAKKKSTTKTPVAYVEFNDSTKSAKKGSKKPVANVEYGGGKKTSKKK